MAVELGAALLGGRAATKTKLACPDPSLVVEGFTVNDFDFSGANEFAMGLGSVVTESKTGRAVQQGAELINSLGQTFGSGVKIDNFGLTRFSWRASNRFKCALDFLVVEMDDGDNTIDTALRLFGTVYPGRGDQDEGGGLLVEAPLGFRSPSITDVRGLANPSRGGLSLEIGSWFSTPPIFVVESLGVKFSRVEVDTGRPLWMTASLQLSSFRMNPYSEVRRFFVGGGSGV